MLAAPSKYHYIHGGTFLLANKLNTVGDKITGENTTKQWFLLLFLNGMEEEAPSITSIARRMDSTRQNVTQLIGPLDKRGYIRIMPSQTDHRSKGIQLTDKGRAYLEIMSLQGAKFISELFDGVDEKELDGAVRVFERMFYNLDNMNKALEGSTYE